MNLLNLVHVYIVIEEGQKKGRGNISWQWGYLTGNILTVRSMVHYSSCFVRLITEFDNYCKYNKPGLNKYITIEHFDICSV